MNKKIYLCTTFREFNKDNNAIIQDRFLASIKAQTYQNYQLIITTFGEKTVGTYLQELFSTEKIIIKESIKKDYKYSLTDVLINAIDEIKDSGILIWCTCDIELQNNYFQTLIDNYEIGITGITHPNYFFLQNLKKPQCGPLSYGIDIFFIDTEILRSSNVYKDIKNYRFKDWGIFEQFLCAIAKKYGRKRINTVNISNVVKYPNDRTAADENSQFFVKSLKQNRPVFDKFLFDNALSIKFSNLLYCHIQFKTLKKPINYIIHNFFDIRNYKSVLKLIMPNWLYKKIKRY